MNAFSLVQDLSSVTGVSVTTLEKLIKKSIFCICQDIEESDTDITKIDLGIGTLAILAKPNEIKYKFVPSKKLELNISKTVITGENPLVNEIEESIKNKILTAYKELF